MSHHVEGGGDREKGGLDLLKANFNVFDRYSSNRSPKQPFLVPSCNTPSQKRLLPFELHAFPFVFAVNRNNLSFLSKLTIT